MAWHHWLWPVPLLRLARRRGVHRLRVHEVALGLEERFDILARVPFHLSVITASNILLIWTISAHLSLFSA